MFFPVELEMGNGDTMSNRTRRTRAIIENARGH